MYPICMKPFLFALPCPDKTKVTWKESYLLPGIQNQLFLIRGGGVNVNSTNTRKVPIILVFCCTVFFKIGDSKKMVKREMTNQR